MILKSAASTRRSTRMHNNNTCNSTPREDLDCLTLRLDSMRVESHPSTYFRIALDSKFA